MPQNQNARTSAAAAFSRYKLGCGRLHSVCTIPAAAWFCALELGGVAQCALRFIDAGFGFFGYFARDGSGFFSRSHDVAELGAPGAFRIRVAAVNALFDRITDVFNGFLDFISHSKSDLPVVSTTLTYTGLSRFVRERGSAAFVPNAARHQAMTIPIGRVQELAYYPIKSMAGVAIESAFLGWHGFQGDRRFAFRRIGDNGGFPWLTASRLPELLLYTPLGLDENEREPTPTHVRTPEGTTLALRSTDLQNSVAEKFGGAVELMRFKHGIFDEGIVSVINLSTMSAICQGAGAVLDTRRFRANIVIAADAEEPFLEDRWIGGRLVFGDIETGATLNVSSRDERCMMINLDPDTAKQDPAFMKAAVRLNANNAGVYTTVGRTGEITVGQSVTLI